MKPTLLIFFFLLTMGAVAFAQDGAKAPYQEVVQQQLQVDKQAMYRGGKTGLDMYFVQHIKYPQEASQQNFHGKVYAKFTIGTKGKVTKIEFLRSDHPLFEKEAKRILKGMGRWIPAYVNQQPVEVSYIYPFVFKQG